MSLERYSSCKLPSLYGDFELIIFRSHEGEEISVLTSDPFDPSQVAFVRIHSQCFTSEVLGSMKCDCREQLHYALNTIGASDANGVVIYLPQEGRGIGLGNKVKAYSLQEQGADTLEANHMLGFDGDLRDFNMAAEILGQLGVKEIRLNTNNPEKLKAIQESNVTVCEIIPSIGHENIHNRSYLKTKAEKMGHIQLKGIPMSPVQFCEDDG